MELPFALFLLLQSKNRRYDFIPQNNQQLNTTFSQNPGNMIDSLTLKWRLPTFWLFKFNLYSFLFHVRIYWFISFLIRIVLLFSLVVKLKNHERFLFLWQNHRIKIFQSILNKRFIPFSKDSKIINILAF